MRDTSQWRKRLKAIAEHLKKTETRLPFTAFCDIELGLYLLSQLAPGAPPHSLWVLLTGYLFPVPEAQNWLDEKYLMLGNARHILTQFRSKYRWEEALKRYHQVDAKLRGFDVDEPLVNFSLRQVSICSNRKAIYEQTLRQPIPYSTRSIRWASAGTYECSDRNYRVTVKIPDELVFPAPAAHNLAGKTEKPAITVTRQALLKTAQWMDTLSEGGWEERLSKVSLGLFNENDTLVSADQLTFDGLMHLIGMVSSGKSTLMRILAVWAAQQNLHVTMVVGDVISALTECRLFDRLGIPVAPILGSSNRDRHTNRLHRAWNAENPLKPFEMQHVGFQWLSTACPLSELRPDVTKPFVTGAQPCLNLIELATSDNEDEEESQPNSNGTYACSLYSACPFHQAQRDLVKAKIWIATPASLVYTRVAQQINAENIRFSELVYRCSDLIIVDEADQVQVQLDNTFSPSQKLFGPGSDGWLSQVQESVVPQLNQAGRGQLADTYIDRWCKAHDIAQAVTSRIYALILHQQPALKEWIERSDYFTAWLILDRLAVTLSDAPKDRRDHHKGYRKLRQLFDDYIDDPLGDRSNRSLSELASQFMLTNNENLVRQQFHDWICQNKEPNITLTQQTQEDAAIQLEFGLLVGVLQSKINQMVRDWKQVEEPLKLQEQSSMLFYSPPVDYEAIIPVSPMGNVLAFQYVKSSENTSGDLRFFKCLGVGRWLLLHLHELFASDGIAGPHVLLLSGTSWAGKAPGYHVQVPVEGVLRSPDEELEAIQKSYFEFSPFNNEQGYPITVSGAKGQGRVGDGDAG